MRTSGVPALLGPLLGEDWKNIGDEDGTAPSARRRDARGVAWKVGLLGGSWRDDEGDAVGFWEERPLRRLEAGDDMVCGWVDVCSW